MLFMDSYILLAGTLCAFFCLSGLPYYTVLYINKTMQYKTIRARYSPVKVRFWPPKGGLFSMRCQVLEVAAMRGLPFFKCNATRLALILFKNSAISPQKSWLTCARWSCEQFPGGNIFFITCLWQSWMWTLMLFSSADRNVSYLPSAQW